MNAWKHGERGADAMDMRSMLTEWLRMVRANAKAFERSVQSSEQHLGGPPAAACEGPHAAVD